MPVVIGSLRHNPVYSHLVRHFWPNPGGSAEFRRDFRFWHQADMPRCPLRGRYQGESGHCQTLITGTASSLYGSITTLLGIGIGTTIGQDYDGTLVPFATGFFLCTLASLAVVLVVEKGRLFTPLTRPTT
jgi:hypothetical protein